MPKYMINVDLETFNVKGGATDCSSALHGAYGPHYDLTVHELGCRCHNSRSVHRPPMRYWDDNRGSGYTLNEGSEKVATLHRQYVDAYARRCSICDVDAHPPYWD